MLTTALVATASALATLAAVLLVLVTRRREPVGAAPASADERVGVDAEALTRDLQLALARYRPAALPSGFDAPPTEARPAARSRLEQLEELLAHMLRAAEAIPGADAALALVVGLGRPIVATLGLSTEEAKRLASTLPAVGNRTRSIAITYEYGDAPPPPAGRRIERGLGVVIPNVPAPALLVVVSRAPAAALGDPQIEMLEEVATRASRAIAALLDASAADDPQPTIVSVDEAPNRSAALPHRQERQDLGQIDRLRHR